MRKKERESNTDASFLIYAKVFIKYGLASIITPQYLVGYIL